MENQTDEQLVGMAVKGDEQALSALVSRYIKLVYSFVFQYVRDRDHAEDLTQEVFVKVWKNLQKFDGSRVFKTWLYTIAKNTCLDFFKQKSAIPFSELDLEKIENISWLNQAAAKTSVETAIDRGLLAGELSNVVMQLAPKYSEIINLYHNQELNFREISDLKKEPLDTVKSRYRRALTQLRKILPNIKE